MNRRNTVALAAAALLAAQPAWADNHETDGPTFNMIHVRTCTFNEGQGYADFERATSDWNRWADEQGFDDYMAITMVPNFHGPDAFDIGWLGMGATAEGFGATMDTFLADGGDIMQGFLDVVSCDSHALWASSEVKAAPQSQPPDSVVIVFRDCKLNDGVTSDAIGEAAGAWGKFMSDNEYPHGEWMWWPVFGGGGAEYDFKLVQGFPNHQAVGQMLEKFGNGGGWRAYDDSLGGIAQCDDGRVYDGTVRRRMAGAE